FWQALKVSWIRRLNTSRSFWMQILATQSAISVPTLRETDYLTVDVLMKCKRTKNPFWQETFNSYIKVRENFLAEYPNPRLLQLINGNNQLTLDGRPANIPSMHKKTLATTINPDLSIMTTTQYMREHEEVMWIKKPKLRADYIKYKNNFKNYVERSAQFKPCLDNDITLNRVILNKVKKGCSFFYKCLSYHKRKDFNWNKQRSYWENIFDKT
ncbi:MAG: hypothetical protein GY782_08030, partial [Gammaproteobacteria bacterium]|nr:hypothetical protein [Gammaproteobacteria bacterium]